MHHLSGDHANPVHFIKRPWAPEGCEDEAKWRKGSGPLPLNPGRLTGRPKLDVPTILSSVGGLLAVPGLRGPFPRRCPILRRLWDALGIRRPRSRPGFGIAGVRDPTGTGHRVDVHDDRGLKLLHQVGGRGAPGRLLAGVRGVDGPRCGLGRGLDYYGAHGAVAEGCFHAHGEVTISSGAMNPSSSSWPPRCREGD